MMWLAPESAFVSLSFVGIPLLLLAGIVLEAVGMALEHREKHSASDCGRSSLA